MRSANIGQRIRRGLVAFAFVVVTASLASPGTAYAKHGNGAAIGSASSAARWPEPPLRLQHRQATTPRHRAIIIAMRRRFTPRCRRGSILTYRRLLCITLRCRTMGRGFTTGKTEDLAIPLGGHV